MREPIKAEPVDMHERESIVRFVEGLKLSASCAKELHAIWPKQGWAKVAEALNGMIVSGMKLAKAKAVTRGALLQHADRIQKKLNTRPDSDQGF